MTAEAEKVVLFGLIGRLPERIAAKLLQDADVQSRLNLHDRLRVGDKPVDRDQLIGFLCSVEQKRAASLKLGEVELTTGELQDDGSIVLQHGNQRFRFDDTGVFSRSQKRRNLTLKRLLSAAALPRPSEAFWIDRVKAGPLNPDEFLTLQKAKDSAPKNFRAELSEKLLAGKASVDDLSSTDEAYFQSLFATVPIPDSYQDAVQIAHSQAAERISTTALALIGPMTVAPDFRFQEVTQKLSNADAASVVEDLLEAGDPLSLLAAFELACARPKDARLEELGAVALDELFAGGSQPSRTIVLFTAALYAVIVLLDWKGPLKSYPVAIRRLAAFLQASQVTRVLGQFDLNESEFLEWVQSRVASRFQLIVPLQRRLAPHWRLEWLQPGFIEAYIRRRCEDVLFAIDEKHRPASWQQRIEFPDERLREDALAVFASTAGPFDEFVAGWEPPRLPDELLASVVENLENGGDRAAVSAALLAGRPNLKEPEQERIQSLLIRELSKLEKEMLTGLSQASLVLAAVWKKPVLASAATEAAFRQLQDESAGVRAVAQAIVAEAAIEKEGEPWAERISAGFHRLGFMVPVGEPAAVLLDVIDKLGALSPALTKDLARPRSAALLAA